MSARVRRHPIMGFFAGLLLGLGLAVLLVIFGIVPMTALWLAILVGGGVVLGIVLAYVTPARAPKART